MARRPLVAGNWKMHKTGAEAQAYAAELRELLGGESMGPDVAVCPPFTALAATAEGFDGSSVAVMAQALHEAPKGAHTGEISAAMIAATGASGTLVGHSERRAAGETDDQVAARLRAALDAGLEAILCVGESLEQREAGKTEASLAGQLRSALGVVAAGEAARLAVAYEPIWAIGTGRTATPQTAQEAIAHLRAIAGETLDGQALRILYGGSVTPDNAAELMAQADIDGALVGGASLEPTSFRDIVRAA
jgi:triosephosphate isomerase